MGTLGDRVSDYFSSLNPLATKIFQETNIVKSKYGDEWSNLSLEEQEKILDDHFINPDVKSYYPQKDDAPECYPKLKINCGENIVADFDDDSMWRDEHSGPFSWYSLSQQDLSIPDPVDFVEEAEENATDESPTKKGKGKKKKKKVKKGKAPTAPEEEVDPENSIKQETNVNDSMSIGQEKPSHDNNHQSLSPSKISSLKSQVKAEEETKLLDSSFESGPDTDVAKMDEKIPVKPKKKKVKVPKAAPPPPPPMDKRWKKHDQETKDTNISLISEAVSTQQEPPLKLLHDAEGGMVSGVFIHESGESSTDPVPVTEVPKSLSSVGAPLNDEDGAVGGEINLGLVDEDVASNNKNGEEPSGKSTFDFLLDW